jgi:hypothetical protein
LYRQLPLPPPAPRPQRLTGRGHDHDLSAFDDVEAPEVHTGMTPTVRARLVNTAGEFSVASGYEMEWSEDESTTSSWEHQKSLPALQYSTSFVRREPVTRAISEYPSVPEYSVPPSQAQVYAPVQAYVAAPQVRSDQAVRYELPAPAAAATSFANIAANIAPAANTAPALRSGAWMTATAPTLRGGASMTATAPALRSGAVYEELEPAPAQSRGMWTAIGVVGLFGAVLFMRLIVSDGTDAVRTSAEPAPSAPSPALAAPSAPPEVHAPLEPAAVKVDAPLEAAAPDIAAHDAEPKLAAPQPAPKFIAAKSAPLKPATKVTKSKPSPVKSAAKSAPKPEKAAPRVATKSVAPARPAPIKTPAPALRPAAGMTTPAPALRGGAGMSTLRVNSLPWSEVFIDGQFVGNTPQTNLPLPAGRHKIKLVNTPLEMSKTISVELKPGEVVTKTVNLSQ